MVKLITINSSHYQANTKSFKYVMREPIQAPLDVDSVALVKCSFYNSSFNITAFTGNNSVVLNWLGTN